MASSSQSTRRSTVAVPTLASGIKSKAPQGLRYVLKSANPRLYTDARIQAIPPPPPMLAKSFIRPFVDGALKGVMLSKGTWSVLTAAGYTAEGTGDGNGFTLRTGQGPCGVSGTTFSCGAGVSPSIFSAVSDHFVGFNALGADSIYSIRSPPMKADFCSLSETRRTGVQVPCRLEISKSRLAWECLALWISIWSLSIPLDLDAGAQSSIRFLYFRLVICIKAA